LKLIPVRFIRAGLTGRFFSVLSGFKGFCRVGNCLLNLAASYFASAILHGIGKQGFDLAWLPVCVKAAGSVEQKLVNTKRRFWGRVQFAL
jgi:hypothetical protein